MNRAETDPRKGKQPKRPYSYTEGTDESPSLLEEEPVDVEESTPADKRSSVESVDDDDDKTPPLFEE
ncbi:hypothetical protein [Pelagibius marinus]|uniref:hypothetical protein n=1 Tax=Pelagibius marinus TaxID=2762760 RepID=UPI00187239BE|nr:hypothetical protein [Pelagibius marinus]